MGKRKASGHVEQQCDVWLTAKPKPTKKQKVLRDPLKSIKNVVSFEPITVPNATKQTALTDFFRSKTPTNPGCPPDEKTHDLDQWSPDYPKRAVTKSTLQRDLNQGGILRCNATRKVHSAEEMPKVAEPMTLTSNSRSTSQDQDNQKKCNQDYPEFERTGIEEMTQCGVKEKKWITAWSGHSDKEEQVTEKNYSSCDRRAFKERITSADHGLRQANDLLKFDRCSQPETESSQIVHTGPVRKQNPKQTVSTYGCKINIPFDSISDTDSEWLTEGDQSFLNDTTSQLLQGNGIKSSSHKIRFIDPDQLHVNTASMCTQTQSMDTMDFSIDTQSSSGLGFTLKFDSELNSTGNKIRFIDPDRLSELSPCSEVPN